MKRNILIAIFSLFAAYSQAQAPSNEGAVQFKASRAGYKAGDFYHIRLKALHNDSVYRFQFIPDPADSLYFTGTPYHDQQALSLVEKLPAGFYQLNIDKNDSLLLTMKSMEVREGYFTVVELKPGTNELPTLYANNDRMPFTWDEGERYLFYTSSIYYQHALPDTFSGGTVPNAWGINLQMNYFFNKKNKHFKIGMPIRYGVNFYRVNYNPAVTPVSTSRFYRFIYVPFATGLVVSWVDGKKIGKNGSPGFNIDAGVVYNIPVSFQYSYINGGHREIHNRIHHWNDVNAFLNIGYNAFFLHADYSPFNYIESPYGTSPKLNVGIGIRFYEFENN